MAHAAPTDFYIDPFSYIGSTLGNALYSGLTLEDVVLACATIEIEREGDTKIARKIAREIFERFDNAVSASIRLKELVNNNKEQS